MKELFEETRGWMDGKPIGNGYGHLKMDIHIENIYIFSEIQLNLYSKDTQINPVS